MRHSFSLDGNSLIIPGIDRIHHRIDAAISWVLRTIDANKGKGSSAYYAPVFGWVEAYPETTGYLIPTLLTSSDFQCDLKLFEKAIVLADWLLSIQDADGWFEAGRHGVGKLKPSVFNTAQVLFGLISIWERTHCDKYKIAAKRAGDWLLRMQDEEGAWSSHSYVSNYVPDYYSYVAWSIAFAGRSLENDLYLASARKAIKMILSHREIDGGFKYWAFSPGKDAFTHTIGYTLEGLLETSIILEDSVFKAETLDAIHRLQDSIDVNRKVAGSYSTQLKGDYSFVCLTGNFQLCLVFSKAYAQTGDIRSLNTAARCFEQAYRRQSVSKLNKNTYGSFAGSHPFWGDYMRFRFPNWSTKYFLDASFELLPFLWKLHND